MFHFLHCYFPVKIFGFISKLVFCGYGIISVLSKQTQAHEIKSKNRIDFRTIDMSVPKWPLIDQRKAVPVVAINRYVEACLLCETGSGQRSNACRMRASLRLRSTGVCNLWAARIVGKLGQQQKAAKSVSRCAAASDKGMETRTERLAYAESMVKRRPHGE